MAPLGWAALEQGDVEGRVGAIGLSSCEANNVWITMWGSQKGNWKMSFVEAQWFEEAEKSFSPGWWGGGEYPSPRERKRETGGRSPMGGWIRWPLCWRILQIHRIFSYIWILFVNLSVLFKVPGYFFQFYKFIWGKLLTAVHYFFYRGTDVLYTFKIIF